MSGETEAVRVMAQTAGAVMDNYNSDAPDGWVGHPMTDAFVMGIAAGRAASVCMDGQDEGDAADARFMASLMSLLDAAKEVVDDE